MQISFTLNVHSHNPMVQFKCLLNAQFSMIIKFNNTLLAYGVCKMSSRWVLFLQNSYKYIFLTSVVVLY